MQQPLRTEFCKEVLRSTEQCKFIVSVVLKHNQMSTALGGGAGSSATGSDKNTSSNNKSKTNNTSEKNVPLSKSTAVFAKKELESVLLALVGNSDKPTNLAIMILEYSVETNSFRIRDFQPIKRQDFGVKIVDETHFDLFFKRQAIVYNFQSESASSQWLIVSSLLKACKLVNDATPEPNEIIVEQPVVKTPVSNTPSNRSSILRSTNEMSLTEFLVDAETNFEIIPSPSTESEWCNHYIQRMQKDKAQKVKNDECQDISIDMFKKTNRQTSLSQNGPNQSNDIAQKATINTATDTLSQEVSRKDNWIQRQLKLKEDEFTEVTPISIVVCAWNVNNKFPSADSSLAKWLHLDEFEADIYAIGMQEIDMTAASLLKEETETGQEWQNLLIKTFADEAKQNRYKLVSARQLVGIYHAIFIKESFANDINEVRNCAEGVGIMGMMGNKGGVGVRFKLFDSTFCFITAHLAPHMGAVERRNQNFHDIVKKTDFGNPSLYRPDQHDFFFWYGDLNYRINQPNLIVREKIKQQDYKFLLKYDQLMIEKNAKNAFVGFAEGEINFDPTYKFDSGTDVYDTSEKGRVPSYTDRILWREDEKSTIVHKSYKSFKEYKMSDHKPVTACFEVGVKKIVEEKYKKCYLDIIKMLDKLENDLLPEVAITGQCIDFEAVKYEEPITQTILLKNTGQVVCEYQFVPQPHEKAPCKPYMTIEPLEGYVIPGETEEIKVTISVSTQKALKLLSGEDKIDDILILHLKNGRDHFISITGTYIQSCFGSTLDKLVKQKCPVLKSESDVELSSFDKDLKIPKELWRLIDLIYHNGMKEEGLFKYSGAAREVHYIRQCLDEGSPLLNPVSNHSIAESLMTFLESLREPVVPFKFYQMCLNASTNSATCHHLISMLPDVHFNTFHYLMSFLREVLKYKKFNSLTLEEVAIIFSRVLLRSPLQEKAHHTHDESLKYYEEQKAKAQFIGHFLKEDKVWTRDEVLRSDELEEDLFDAQDDDVSSELASDSTSFSLLQNDQLKTSESNSHSNNQQSTSQPLSADEFL
ncbi:phosphatidylinositol polyphosphate 5-phosphatase [Naegleria gruberi]|uniref:Phosphatidylinositol polyphosphate 5-phosphatase n=1 Tax=Naegleria gruberi TaxID=5762 RepID=D2VLH1_NAEGR|nr:phosphatidylinositol polyphosphate 5-phosphatase [Naegleria gruberi]EFC42384.1 phosphatidylinositol polyphosphate 5-phosphatase [Naegleria gruberi]|eukprot:XP_002675128.1 phosphatidylinositol polyphosphate 5-phosphatase [Naegleria gruberi strain NEG-M]